MEKNTKVQKDKIQRKDQKEEKRKLQINNFLMHYFKLFVFVILIIMLTAGYFMLIRPKYKKVIRDIALISADKEVEYLTQQRYLDKLNELKAIYKNINPEDKNKINVILPSQTEVEDLFSEIEVIVLKNGLLLASLQVELKEDKASSRGAYIPKSALKTKEEEELPKEIGQVSIKMEIIGTDYNGFKNMLRTLENNLRLMDIIQLSFSPSSEQTSLELLAYYLK